MAGANRTRRIITGGGIAAVLALAAIPALAVPPESPPGGGPTRIPATGSPDPAPPATDPEITQSGSTLTLNRQEWGNDPSDPNVSQAWIRCEPNETGCGYIMQAGSKHTAQTYTLGSADAGKKIKVRVRKEGTPPDNYTEVDTAFRAGPPPPPAPPPPKPKPKPAAPALTAPRFVQRPRISGRIREGSVIQGTAGRWTGTQPISFSYRWRRCGETGCGAIPDARRPAYRLTDADVGGRVELAVTADNRARGVVDATSNLTTPVPPIKIKRVRARVTIGGRVTRSGVRLTTFRVRAERGARISILCRGRRCPLKRLSKLASNRSLSVRRLRRRVLPGGTLIAVRVTKPFRIGKYTRLRVRAGRFPLRRDRCLKLGSTKPSRCRRR